MSQFIAIDCGKYNTKVNAYLPSRDKMRRFKFRTKIGPGTFEDDMIEKGTFIIQIDDGPVYKVGNAAKQEPEMETSKKSLIHQVCTMGAAAIALGEGEFDDVSIVIGIPLDLANLPEERIAYKNYILDEQGKQHTVRIKHDSEGPVTETRFTFEKRLVYPEGIGVLYEYPAKLDGPTAIIDIGNLNTNNTYADRFNILTEACFTGELGGKILISGLAQTLTSELGARCDDNLVASTLSRSYEERYLRPANGNKELAERSRRIIDDFTLEHVKMIKQRCDTHHWPLDFMNVVCIGGTAKLLAHEIAQVFGENAFIPEAPEYVNVDGFLRKMCADAGINLESVANSHAS